MAGGYWHDPDGIPGVVRVLRSLQRQIDEMRGSAAIKSSVLRGDKMEFLTTDGDALVVIGTNDDLPAGTPPGEGLYVYDTTNEQFILVADRHPSSGDVHVLVGTASYDLTSFEVHATNIYLTSAQHVVLTPGGDAALVPTGDVVLGPDGELKFYIGTTTNPANLNQTSNNIRVVSSGRKYKADIQDSEIDPADVLALRPRTWIDRGELERDPSYANRTPGFIAEELDEHPTLRQFVVYNDEGQPDSIYYDRLLVALVPVVQQQEARIAALEGRLAALEERA